MSSGLTFYRVADDRSELVALRPGVPNISLSAQSGHGTALLVTPSSTLEPGNVALKGFLEGEGYTVVHRPLSDPESYDGIDVVVVSIQNPPGDTGRYVNPPVGVVAVDSWRPLGMGTNLGYQQATNDAHIAAPHPVSSGLSGAFHAYQTPQYITWELNLQPNTAVIATRPDRPTQAVGFAYDAGSQMPSRFATTRHVALGFHREGLAAGLTATARRLLSQAVEWARQSAYVAPGGPDLQPDTTWYVATTGSDGNSGTLAAPLATLTEARNRLRARPDKSQPATVALRGGTYYQTLTLEPQDSGTSTAPITWTSYPGETATISGGQVFGPMQDEGGGVARVQIPQVQSDTIWPTRMLINGVERERSRMPETGFYSTVSPNMGASGQNLLIYSDQVPSSWAASGVRAEMNAYNLWEMSRKIIQSVSGSTVTMASPGLNLPGWIWQATSRTIKFCVQNTAEGMTAGRWRLTTDGWLRYRMQPGEVANQLSVTVPVVNQIMRLNGNPSAASYVQHVRFERLRFALANGESRGRHEGLSWTTSSQSAAEVSSAIVLAGARNVRFSGCEITQTSGHALQLANGCRDNIVEGCHIHDIGAGGIFVGPGSTPSGNDTLRNNVIRDNHIHKYGRRWPQGCGILWRRAGSGTIEHNLIHDGYYTGISIGWQWGFSNQDVSNVTVRKNLAYEIGQHTSGRGDGELSDMGGVYTLGPCPGTVVEHNVFRDIDSEQYGGTALYPDEGTSGVAFRHNLCIRPQAGMNLGYKDVLLHNNLIYDPGNHDANFSYGMLRRGSPPDGSIAADVRRNVFVFLRSPRRPHAPFGPWLTEPNFHIRDQVYWSPDGQLTFTASVGGSWDAWRANSWQGIGKDANSVIADPLVDTTTWQLGAGSPALARGFVQLQIADVGPRTPWRTALVDQHNVIS